MLEFYIGAFRYKLHPLNIMGRVAVFLEKIFYGISNGVFSGILFNIFTIFIISAVFIIIDFITFKISPVLFYPISIYILFSFLSAGGLRHESLKIHRLLKANDISGARKNLLSLAGRDSYNLDAPEISRAVVESVAENTGDGVGSVVFYFAAGLIFGLFVKLFDKPLEIPYAVAVALGIIFAVIYK
ncbi:MAG: cobalamin biosynthesis protein CobD/CbiB, partial [bacterium]